jgi:hypothetical protein
MLVSVHMNTWFVKSDESQGPDLRRKNYWEREKGIQRGESAGDFPIARRHLVQCKEFSRVRKVIHTTAGDIPKLADNRTFLICLDLELNCLITPAIAKKRSAKLFT